MYLFDHNAILLRILSFIVFKIKYIFFKEILLIFVLIIILILT